MADIDSYFFILCLEHHTRGLLASSLTRTQSDPIPSLQAVPEQPEHQSSRSQPVDHLPYRSRRPISKQQRVLSAVSRVVGKESLGIRTSAGSTESRTSAGSAGSTEASRACQPEVERFILILAVSAYSS